jgi:hypothetical protein
MHTGTFLSEEEDRHRTGFIIPFGSFRYERMTYGLSGAPSTIQRVMDAMLAGLRDVEVLVYLDDLLLFSEKIEDHMRPMRLVFERVREANFKLNVAKCTFAVPEVVYVGHVMNKNGVTPDQVKLQPLRSFPDHKQYGTFWHFWACPDTVEFLFEIMRL